MAARWLHLVFHHPGRRGPAIGRCPEAPIRRPSAVGQPWPAWPGASVPPASDSSIMGSQEPETAEAAAPGGPFSPGKGLSAGPGRGAGRYHGCSHGPRGTLKGDLHPTAPQLSGSCPHAASCLATPAGQVVLEGQASRSSVFVSRALEPRPPDLFHPEAAIKNNPWPRGGPFTKGGPGPPAHPGGDAGRHCQS